MDPDLRLGTTKMDITPKNPMPLAGFGKRKGNFEGISAPLYCRIFLFEQTDQNGGQRRALFVSADLIWWGPERIPRLRMILSSRFGIQKSAIILHATHSHSGPQTTRYFTQTLGIPDPDYIHFLEAQLMTGVSEAEDNLEPVMITKVVGTSDIGINRSKMVDRQMMALPNKEGTVDPEVTVINFMSEKAQHKGMFVHYSCHPTTTADNFVSPEFPGHAVSRIEQVLGGGIVAGYLQGCCGNVRPALIRNGSFYRGTHKDAKKLGDKLANEVLSILKKSHVKRIPLTQIHSQSVEVDLLFKRLPSLEELKKSRDEDGVLGEWSELLLQNPERLEQTIPLSITCLKLADDLSLLAMNGEMVVEYGLYAKKIFNGKALPMGYSNGMIGYVPTAKQLSEGGYEAKESTVYFGLPSDFSPEVEGDIKKAINQLKESILS